MIPLQKGEALQGLDIPDMDGWIPPNLHRTDRKDVSGTQTREVLEGVHGLQLKPCTVPGAGWHGGYLSGGHVIFEWVDGETEDVVIVAQIEALRVLLPVVDDGHRRHVIHNLGCLRVKQIIPAVIAPIPAQRHGGGTARRGCYIRNTETKKRVNRSQDFYQT